MRKDTDGDGVEKENEEGKQQGGDKEGKEEAKWSNYEKIKGKKWKISLMGSR